jgi:hypothetical protein
MSKVLVYAYVAMLIGANFIFGFIVPIPRDSEDSKISSDEWSVPIVEAGNDLDLDELVSSGFWGDVDSTLLRGLGETKEVAAEEAKKLRAQVKAIIKRTQNREVLFSVKNGYHRVLVGEILPGTNWVLIEIGEDWLKLSKDGQLDNPELLKLFAMEAKDKAAITSKDVK